MTNKHGKTVLCAFAALVFTTLGCGSGGGSKGGGLFGGGGGGGVGGGSDPILTPEQETGATAVCEKADSCGLLSSSEMSECPAQIAGMLQVIPNPDKFSACVNTLSCSTLEDSQSLLTCLDLNKNSYACSGSSSLTGCDNSGKCATISCPDVCELMGGYTFDHCGASNDTSKAKNICWCRA